MDDFTKVILFGKDHGAKGEIYSQSLNGPKISLATSAGVTSKPNEDAMGATMFGPERVLAIADGHWGREASEIAISRAVEFPGQEIHPATEGEIQAGMLSLFEQVNNQLYDFATTTSADATPETTLIVCLIRQMQAGPYLYWSSFGDSYLFLLRDQKLIQINSPHPRWLGYLSKMSENPDARAALMKLSANEARFVGVADGLETGQNELQPGDLILLCTDGLVGSDRTPAQWILDELSGILNSDQPVPVRVEELVAFALARGEKDNISCVLAEV